MYSIVDLFCGCGGLSRGFEWTGCFGTQLAVEKEIHPANAFEKNISNTTGGKPVIYQGDICALTANNGELRKLLKASGLEHPGQLDVLVGGPPCQGFSRNRADRSDSGGVFFDDPRNKLYREFLNILAETKPKMLLVENVREFLNFNNGKYSSDLLKILSNLGYKTIFEKVNMADFGVPQKRWRVFFIACRKDLNNEAYKLLSFPRKTHSESVSRASLLPSHKPWNTVCDAIKDLPSPSYKKSEVLEYTSEASSELSLLLRKGSKNVSNHIARILSDINLARIKAVGKGRMNDVDKELQTNKHYGSAYGRLDWDKPSLTITTWVYHVGSGRFAHPCEDRAITMREAARLQTFDDNFIFPDLINPSSQMIGNAVPPLMAFSFANIFKQVLDMHYGK